MRPELFRVFDISAPAYFVLLITGFAFAGAIAVLWARRIGLDPDRVVDLVIVALIMGVVGGRIGHVLFDGKLMDYVHLCTDPSLVDWKISKAECLRRGDGVWDAAGSVCHPTESDCFAWSYFWAGGLTYYGGLVASTIAGLLLCKRDGLPLAKVADFSGVGITLGLGFGRMGCLLAGCCFGQPHDGPLSLRFPPRSPASDNHFDADLLPTAADWSLSVHPTQVYEAAMSFAVAGFCMLYIQNRKRYDGQVILWALSLYAVGRFLLEFLRADDRGGALGLSTSQLIGVVIVVICYAIHRRLVRRVVVPREHASTA